VTLFFSRRRAVAVLLASALLAGVLLAGQAGADASAPAGRTADTGRTLGRTGDAYLSGLRVFAALVIWNKLEPQFHGYYSNLALKDQKFLMPNLRLVLLLDPQFVQAYYDVPWVLAGNGRVDEALSIAREGIANNPRSGLLRMAYGQLIFLLKKDYAAAAAQAGLALGANMQWKDEVELWENLSIARDVYAKAGMKDKAAQVIATISAMEARHGGADRIPGQRDVDGPSH
jgi:tetratricopeptide (TPR) repeat protein